MHRGHGKAEFMAFYLVWAFTKSKADSNLYYKVEDGNPLILLLYVDDLFVIGEDGLIADTKRKLLPSSK